MPTANEQIQDEYIERQINIIRYAMGLKADLVKILGKTEADLKSLILEYLALAGGDRALVDAAGREWQRDFEAAVRDLRLGAWEEISAGALDDVAKLSVIEAAAAAKVVTDAVPVQIRMKLPEKRGLEQITKSQPFQGRTLKQWMAKARQSDVERIVSAAKVGLSQGITPRDIANSIAGGRQNVAKKAYRDIESVLLTVASGVSNEARQALYQANSDIINKEIFIAALDSRTTIICASNDNQIYDIGQGPMPPLHFRCRSARVPYINPDNLGDRPFNPTTEKQLLREYSRQSGIDPAKKRDSLPRGHKTKFDAYARQRRRELIGQVPAKTSYSDFLKRRPKSFQNDFLGPARAELFREGKASLDKFVSRDGSTLTLAQLEKRGISL